MQRPAWLELCPADRWTPPLSRGRAARQLQETPGRTRSSRPAPNVVPSPESSHLVTQGYVLKPRDLCRRCGDGRQFACCGRGVLCDECLRMLCDCLENRRKWRRRFVHSDRRDGRITIGSGIHDGGLCLIHGASS